MKPIRVSRLVALVALLLSLPSIPTRAAIDILENAGNGDGLGDVWQMKYDAEGLAPDADTDGDGRSNLQESGAGTDPRSPSDIIEVRNLELNGTELTLHWPSVLGKRYKVQSTTTLANAASWAEVSAGFLEGTGAEMNHTVTIGGPGTFYRVAVYDKDTDGDGVSDWEELQVGLDPENTHANGASGPGDLEWLRAGITTPSTVTVSALDHLATEPAVSAPATDSATIVVSRTGGIKALNVTYTVAGPAVPGADYQALPGSASLGLGATFTTITVTPLADTNIESPEAAVLTVNPHGGYTVGAAATAGVIIQDKTSPSGNGLRAAFWNEASNLSTTNPPVFPGNPVVTRIDPVIDYDWADSATQGVGSPAVGVNSNYFSSRWTGEVLPEFSQIYTFQFEVNTGARLWVNGELLINNWPPNSVASSTFNATIELQAGVRYPIVVEQYEITGTAEAHLRWQSANQPLQIIPQTRLFADTAPQITGNLDVLLIKDSGPYTYQIAASGRPSSYAAANLPPGWSINSLTGLISGNPNLAGEWSIPITATNSTGSGSAVLRVQVIATGGSVTREVWSGVPGTAVADIPLGLAPTGTSTLNTLEGPLDAADNYGARVRGYITAPTTGVYKFFLAAANTAELWISNDEEPTNLFQRAKVTGSTAHRQWAAPTAGKSSLLWLDAGRRYYFELLHKAGTGSDHVSVGWLKPGEGGADPDNAPAPSEVLPGYVLSPFAPPTSTDGESTLYVTNMSAQGGAQTSGYGSATLRLSADESQAVLLFNYSNLTSPVAAKHIHSDAHGGAIIFDIDDFAPAQDGSYTWRIEGVGAISAADILNVIKTGQAYLNIHTGNYPAGEIRGNFRLAAASQVFTPPAPVTWTDPNSASSPESHLNRSAAARFLNQATFGVSGADANANANPDDIESVQSLGFEGWLDAQFAMPEGFHFPFVFANRNQTDGQNATYSGTGLFNSWWRNSVTREDQLRQRLAFALSEILVVSENGPLDERGDALSDYYDMLLEHAFGNFRDILIQTTLHPSMGRYLDMLGNRKPNKSTGRIPNENYAREILQLFSLGLNRMHPDGSFMLNSKGELIPTYDQEVVIGFAHVFTGWYYHANVTSLFPTSMNAAANWVDPMTEVPGEHFTGQKRLLNNVVMRGLPVLPSLQNQVLNPFAAHSTAQVQTPEYQTLPAQELAAAHDSIFNHPNVGPFICRQLIQRLVTSTPSRGYLYRVVSKFNDNGSGVRGDMKAVIKAILLDYEARSMIAAASQGFGKQREPISRIAAVARAFPSPAGVAGSYTQAGADLTITTAAPHLYTGSPSIYLDFADSTTGDPGQPLDATYAVTVTGPNTFTCRTKSFETATYAQSGAITVFTTTGNGFLYGVGNAIQIQYLTGSPIPPPGSGTIGFRSSDELRIAIGGPTTRYGTFPTQTAGATSMTLTVSGHGITAGTSVHLDFMSNSATLPSSGLYTINSVTTNTFTVTRKETTAMSSGAVFVTLPANLPAATTSGNATVTRQGDMANRSGPLAVTYSDWNMGSTDTDLNQTPLRSPTVFNFFLPDYQFPGILATAGLITPEFEITSETSVIRQVNFLYNGIFNDAFGSANYGLSSFKSGGRDIIIDLRPWMNGTKDGLPWVHNNNLTALIDELNVRLTGGQIPAAARTIIRNYVQTLAYTTPTAAQRRDRIRAVVHLLVTSPDFTIQK